MSRLETILKVRQRAEEKSAKALAHARLRLQQGHDQARELESLAESYRNSVEQGRPDRAPQLSLFRTFYAELHSAKVQQAELVAKLAEHVKHEKSRFLRCHTERKALEQLIDARDERRKYERKRAERKALDASYRLSLKEINGTTDL